VTSDERVARCGSWRKWSWRRSKINHVRVELFRHLAWLFTAFALAVALFAAGVLDAAGMVARADPSIDQHNAEGEEIPLAPPSLEADSPASDWEATALTEPVRALFTPASGAFFARTDRAAMRSDDGGDTWYAVPLPADSRLVAVDPTNQTVLFAAGEAGLYKTEDDAATWTLVLPLPDERVLGLAVSPADAKLVYLGLANKQGGPQVFRFLRSRTGGVTWEQIDRREGSLCGLGLPLLQPHPTDPHRLLRVHNCYSGRTSFDTLDLSQDEGVRFTSIFRESFVFPHRLVGGQGSVPGRWYLAADRDDRAGGSTLWRSDDDGGTWIEVLAFARARTAVTGEKVAPDVNLGGLTYDPSRPDRVFVALGGEGEGVLVSVDGAVSWMQLGRQDLGRANALALGIDGRNLYAATVRGLWRLRLTVMD